MSSKTLLRWIFNSKAPSEEPTMTDPDDKPDSPPQSSAEPDPPPSDLDRTAENPPVEELERLDVGVSEPSVEEGGGAEKGSSAGGVEDGDGDGKSEGGSDGDKDENGDSQSDDEKKEERRRVNKYPVRPEAEDCSYYIKTGTCKFGSNCKFNHPVRRKNQIAKDKVKEKEEPKERPGQTECKYYLKTGGCKFGKACRYNHSRPKAFVAPFAELNFLGLPIRPGEKECPFYMRTGSCKYAANCRFNHPDPTAGGVDPPSEYGNGGSAPLQSASQFPVASWSSQGALNESTPFVPMMYSPTHGVSAHNAEWNGYQFPVNPPGPVVRPPSAFIMKHPVTDSHIYPHHQMVIDEYPERPGQPDCSYFLKTGDCKFRSNCKYHHPKDRISKSPPVLLSDKGLPLRPDQNICSYYSRYGICKFGPACKFDHPVHLASSTMTGLDQPSSVGDSATSDGPMMDGTRNSSDAIQQSV
ncbi:zinc finger CCCH domain-containing protein 43 isoform X1 [Rhodamnia argentea]|uniref:Zinc finger CCCH domain-containing protein 43 isoform X1 n=1 Tax=Rhodamnia argentea TaxID=178133 RepID=A0A8B8PBE3_9MYRT|nr:zinc finger CCCH domain-containing protein 43 isoform X1 [Rhodamnia argentea]